jgi:hypothetical protein
MISSLYLHSRSQTKPLRIGVMVDDFKISKAFRKVMIDIKASDFANLELVIVNRQEQLLPNPAADGLSRYLSHLQDRDRRRVLLYALFQKFDQRQLADPDPLDVVDCTDILGNSKRLDVTPITKGSVHRFPPDAIADLLSHDLDVILRFGFNILRGEVLTSARYGIWSFHHGDNEFYRGGPPLFWEVVEDNPCSGAILQVLTEKLDDGPVLCKSLFATARGLRPSRNLCHPIWGSTHFVIRKLHELHECGWGVVKQHMVSPALYQGKTEIYRAPFNSQMLKWLVPKVGKRVIRQLNPLHREKIYHWRICLRRNDSPELIAGPSPDKSNFRWMRCPPGHYYADPFLLQNQGQVWLFFEDYIYGEKRGRIRCAPVQSDSSIGAPTVCLDRPYHLSYPLLFHHDGEIFMIPESAENHSVELWRATNFPFSWKLEKRLFVGSLFDTTPLFHEGRWYFFTTLSEPSGNCAFGALFSSDSLTGNWVRHPNCPISTDVRYARSAGAILKVENRLLRPVQDCSENYGRRIHVEEILELTPDAYRGRLLHSIEPDWNKSLKGVHTYAFCASIEAVDALSYYDRREIAALGFSTTKTVGTALGGFRATARMATPCVLTDADGRRVREDIPNEQ